MGRGKRKSKTVPEKCTSIILHTKQSSDNNLSPQQWISNPRVPRTWDELMRKPNPIAAGIRGIQKPLKVKGLSKRTMHFASKTSKATPSRLLAPNIWKNLLENHTGSPSGAQGNAFCGTSGNRTTLDVISTASHSFVTDKIRLTRQRCRPKKLAEEWECDRIMCGDGSRDRNGRLLATGVFYGASGYQVGPEGFHAVDIESLDILKVSARRLKRIFVKCVTYNSKLKGCPQPPVLEQRAPKATCPTYVREVCRQWCEMNPGVAIYGHAISGARPPFKELNQFLCFEKGPIFEHENEGFCLRAAIINAVWRVRGHQAARELRSKLSDDMPFVRHIGEDFLVLHKYRMGMDIRRVRHNMYFFDSLAETQAGVYIVRLHKRGKHCVDGFDHTVVIDCSAKLLLDSAEKYPLRLCRQSLFLCAGGHPQYSRIIEVRRICESREV